MVSDHQKNKVLLSRYFNENTYLVAGMCWRCYSECTDVKIVGINRSFLNQVKENTNAKDLKHCDGDFFELDHYNISNSVNQKGTSKDMKENQALQHNEDFRIKNDGIDINYSIKNSKNCIRFKSEPQNLVLKGLNQTINNLQDSIQHLATPESDIFHNSSIYPINKEEIEIQSTFPKLLDTAEHFMQHADDSKEFCNIFGNSPTSSVSDEKLTILTTLDPEEHLMQDTDDTKDYLKKRFCSGFKLTPLSSAICKNDKNEIQNFDINKTENFGDSKIAISKMNYTVEEVQDIIGATSQNCCVNILPPKQENHDSSKINLSEYGNDHLVCSRYFLDKPVVNFGTTQLSQTSEFQGFDYDDFENSNHVKVQMKEVLWKIENKDAEDNKNSLSLKQLDPNHTFSKFFTCKTKNDVQSKFIDLPKPLISNIDRMIKKELFKKCGKVILDVKREIENLDMAMLKKYSDNYVLTPPIWHPPKSPHNLIEEDLYHDPWALLVATIFLNRTSAKCARQYIEDFLANYPNPFEVLRTAPSNFEKYFKKLGLQTVRSLQVWKMSRDFVTKDWKDVTELYGIGRYARDAFCMFCLGNFDVQPEDRYLKIYKAWYEKVYNKKGEDFDEKFEGAVGYRDREWLFDDDSEICDDLCDVNQRRGDDKAEI